MTRLDRLTAILIHLQTKRVVRAQELAERFGVSLRTVYRDVRSLEAAGVPIGAEAGVGYFLDGYHLPPVMLTRAEVSALLFAGKFMEQFTDDSLRQPFASALDKVRSVLKRSEQEHLDDLAPNVAVVPPSGRTGGPAARISSAIRSELPTDALLDQLQTALVQQHLLRIEYEANYSGETSRREVEPLGLVHYGGHWHLMAYCRLRQDYRDFRVNRMQDVVNTGQRFPRRDRLSLADYLDRLQGQQDLPPEVIVTFDAATARFAQEQRYAFGFVDEELIDGYVRMHFLTPFQEGLARWLLMYGEGVTVEEPAEFKAQVAQYAEETYRHYFPKPC